MYNIAIIGAGQLGSRHLQALKLIDREIYISIVDPSQDSQDIAKQRFDEMPANDNVRIVQFLRSLKEINKHIDVGIIATNADVRRIVIEGLLDCAKVKYLILDKILFQKIKDYKAVGDLLRTRGTKAWVNCTRRMWPFYQQLRKDLQGSKFIEISIYGSKWGLGCNGIHFIDLIAFLIDDVGYKIDSQFLDQKIYSTKRQGFVEFTGKVCGIFNNGCKFEISSYNRGEIPTFIRIITEDRIILISEPIGKAWILEKNNKWQWDTLKVQEVFQSQLTHLVVQQILDSGVCVLTPFEESSILHKTFLQVMLDHYNNINQSSVVACPIT